jgi:hypothetical protein
MVIYSGKTKNIKPPYKSGPNCRRDNLINYTLAKRMVISVAKQENLTTPPMSSKKYRARIF